MAVVKLRLSEVVAQWLERVWVDFHYSEVMVSDNLWQLLLSNDKLFCQMTRECKFLKLFKSCRLDVWQTCSQRSFNPSVLQCDKVDRFIQLVSSGHPQFLPVAMKLRTTKQKKQKEWELSLKVLPNFLMVGDALLIALILFNMGINKISNCISRTFYRVL